MSDLAVSLDNDSGAQSRESPLNRKLLRELLEGRIPDGYDENTVARAETNIRHFQANCSGLAFEDLIALMNNETGSLNIYHEDDQYLQEKIDLQALQLLYGVMRYTGEGLEDAAKLTYVYYYHCCEQDGDDRKFVDWPEAYRQNQLREAIDGFEFGDWHRWRRRENADGFDQDDYRNWTGDYGDICYDITLALLSIACEGLDPSDAVVLYGVDLPIDSEAIEVLHSMEPSSFTKIGPVGSSGPYRLSSGDSGEFRYVPVKAVIETAVEVDDGRSKSTYKNVIRRLRKRGAIKWAEIKQGVDYRIYPSHFPDPKEAERIKFEGEEYTPQVETARKANPTLRTDGGKTETEIYVCPVEGCSRTIVGKKANLIHHVRQAGDDAHRFKRLTEDLEVEVDRDKYRAAWGPGISETEVSGL